MSTIEERVENPWRDVRRRLKRQDERLGDAMRRLTAVENTLSMNVDERIADLLRRINAAENEKIFSGLPPIAPPPPKARARDYYCSEFVRRRMEEARWRDEEKFLEVFSKVYEKAEEERRVRAIVTAEAAAFGEACRQRFVELCEEVGLLEKGPEEPAVETCGARRRQPAGFVDICERSPGHGGRHRSGGETWG